MSPRGGRGAGPESVRPARLRGRGRTCGPGTGGRLPALPARPGPARPGPEELRPPQPGPRVGWEPEASPRARPKGEHPAVGLGAKVKLVEQPFGSNARVPKRPRPPP